MEKTNLKTRGNKVSAARESAPRHAYLTLQKAPNKALMERLERAGNLKIQSLAQIYRDGEKKYFIYQIRCHAGIARSLDLLAGKDLDDIVYGISPVEDNDKVTRKIFENRGFGKGEKADKNRIYAFVDFYPDFSRNAADSLIRAYCDSIIEAADDRPAFIVAATPPKLLRLSRHDGVRAVREHILREEPTVIDGRAIMGVDNLQQFDLGNMPSQPTVDQYWCPDTAFTGNGISVGVYDTGIDTTRLDFREVSGIDTIFRKNDTNTYLLIDYNGHGTHVASTIGGNGWNPVENYKYRGIAPRVKFSSYDKYHPLNRPDNVSNHSHLHSNLNWYDNVHATEDNNIFDNHKIVVSAAGNNGLNPSDKDHGIQHGYYSIGANAKNYITVGASYSAMTHEEYPLRAEFSSMGPTRDGRIKPDVMGPGDSHTLPHRSASNPMIVEIDSVALIGTSGTLKAAWGFQNGTMNWGTTNNISPFDTRSKIGDITAANGILRYEDQGHGSYIWSDSTYKIAASAPRCELNDTLLLRYRINIPPQERIMDELEVAFLWRADRDNLMDGYVRGGARFRIPVGSQGFTTVKVCLGNADGDWKKFYSTPSYYNEFVTMRLDIRGVGTAGILAASRNVGGDTYDYVRMAGTSMATPHVTGVIALMLEKYKRNYLDPVNLSVDGHAFWNSTAKALLVHTAADMVKTTPFPCESPNPDTQEPLVYHNGPDYATGWGLVNALKAVNHVDTNLFKQDTIDGEEVIIYKFTKPEGGNTRISLAWDDAGITDGNDFGNAAETKLVNNLDLHVIDPSGGKHLPWVLDSLPQPAEIIHDQDYDAFINLNGIDPITQPDIKPAYRGIDSINNVEVVDMENAPAGEYTVVITGKDLGMPLQHFSLVADYHLERVSGRARTKTGLIMGFESDTLWSIVNSSGTLSSSTVKTEGNASLEITGNGWQQIKSSDINTEELRNVTNRIAVDLFVGATQTNPYWTGQVQLFINCPSASIYNQHINTVDLTGFPLDVFSTLSFALPQNIVNILNGSYSDFSFSLSINTNANTRAYYFDNMRFEN